MPRRLATSWNDGLTLKTSWRPGDTDFDDDGWTGSVGVAGTLWDAEGEDEERKVGGRPLRDLLHRLDQLDVLFQHRVDHLAKRYTLLSGVLGQVMLNIGA